MGVRLPRLAGLPVTTRRAYRPDIASVSQGTLEIEMAVAVVFLPLVAAIIAGFFGRAIGDRGSQVVTCGALLISAALGIVLFRDILAARSRRSSLCSDGS